MRGGWVEGGGFLISLPDLGRGSNIEEVHPGPRGGVHLFFLKEM